MPGEEPAALEEFGTTAEEQRETESHDRRLAREEPEPEPEDVAIEEREGPSRLVEPDGGDREKDMIAEDAGPDTGGYGPEERATRVEPE